MFRNPLDRPHLKSNVSGVSRTHRAHKDACCINRIMSTVNRTGMLPINPRRTEPQYGDVSGLNKPLSVLISEQESTLSELLVADAAQRKEAAVKRKAAKDAKYAADVEAAVSARLSSLSTQPQK